MGKLTIFDEVLSTRSDDYLWLVIVAVVNSVISAWYYLRILLVAFMKPEDAENPIRLVPSRSLAWSVGIAAVGTILVGILPSKTLTMSDQAGRSLAITAVPSLIEAPKAASVEATTGPMVAAPHTH
jgi:NADH-quinone oxidoreductase subunit N